MMEYLYTIIEYIVNIVDKMGYTGIVITMFLQSSFFPFPSEVIMPSAGYLAAIGKMNIYIAVFCGVVGSILGALFNYYLAFYFGRRFILKYGKYFFIDEKNFERGERFLQEHGNIGTFIGRLIPVIRQFISFPAGLIKMNLNKFIFYTGTGSAIWVIILVIIGYVAGKNQELVKQYSKQATVLMLICVVIILAIYIWRKYYVSRDNHTCSEEE